MVDVASMLAPCRSRYSALATEPPVHSASSAFMEAACRSVWVL